MAHNNHVKYLSQSAPVLLEVLQETVAEENKEAKIVENDYSDAILKDSSDKSNRVDNDDSQKCSNIVDELIETEENYINNLKYVVEEYLNYMRTSVIGGCQVGKCNLIFGNIEDLYLGSTIFLEDLKKYKNNYDELGKIFKKYKNFLERYPIYFRTHNVATSYIQGDFKQIVKKRELELGDKLGLSSHLVKPIQRLGKYKLLLTRLEKSMKGSSVKNVKDAISLVKKILRRGNDSIWIDSIESNPFSTLDMGDFVMLDNFRQLSPIYYNYYRKKDDIVLLLFKKMILITSKFQQKLIYKDSILITSLALSTNGKPETNFTFTIVDQPKKMIKKKCSFTFGCENAQVKKVWVNQIEAMLWAQFKEHKEEKRQRGEIKPIIYINCKPNTTEEDDFVEKVEII